MLVPDGLLFGVHMFITQCLGYLLFCIRYAKCCASDRILLFFSHLIPCDYGPQGMYRSDPGLQSIQLDWSKGMLVRVQPSILTTWILDMWRIRSFISVDWSQLSCATANFVALSVLIGINYRVLQQTLYNFVDHLEASRQSVVGHLL